MKKIFLLFFVALTLGTTSCDEFLSVDEKNPNSASSVATKLILPAAINNVARTMNNPRRFEFVYLWHGLWSISQGYSQPVNLVQYRLFNSSYQNGFLELYTTGENFDIIERASTDAKDVYFSAISKIMKVYIFQNLVDCWGDVPYSEAFKASEGILKPKFDKQQEIYEDLVLKLDDAIKQIQAAGAEAVAPDAGSDVMFSGDMKLWAKFANTLKLRILVHQAGMTGRDSYIKSAIATTSSVGYLGAKESALVNPGYLASDGKMNVFYETFFKADGTSQSDGLTYYMAGKNVVDYMLTTNDLRISKFFQKSSAGDYNGNVLGDGSNMLPFAKTSQLGYISGDQGTMIGTFNKSLPLLTDFESLFIQAEAVQRGYISGDAKALYDAAIIRSYVYMNLSATDAADFLDQENGNVNFTAAANKLQLIITQKWVSLNGIAPVEIWTDYRRSGYPAGLSFSPDADRENNTPPVRLLYPQYELSVNNANVVSVGEIDPFTSKIFWQNR